LDGLKVFEKFIKNVSFSVSVSVLQVFSNELRAVIAVLEANMNQTQRLQDELRGCTDIVGDALRGFDLRSAAQNLTSDDRVPEVIPEDAGTWGWPQYTILVLCLSIVGQLALIADRLGVPRTEVSKFLKSFAF